MKRFLIRYTYSLPDEPNERWHARVAEFVAALDADPELKGRIGYKVMKLKGTNQYLHLAEPADDQAVQMLQQRDFFKRYTEETKRVSGGTLETTSLETVGETAR